MRKLMILLIFLMFSAAALGGNIALRAGFTPALYGAGKFTYASGSAGTTVKNNVGVDLTQGYAVQCYYMGANGYINDPGHGDDTLIGTLKYVGDDTDTWSTFTATDGKFYHDYTATGFSSGANIYFRVWDNAVPSTGGALFGESKDVTAAYDDSIMPLPNNHGLLNPLSATTTAVQFTQATPEAPTGVSGTPHQAAAGGSPTIDINSNSCLHGRWYNFEVSSPEATNTGPFTFNGYKTASTTNSKHYADVNTSTVKSTAGITLGQTDDNKWVKVRVRAEDDYGDGAWTEAGPYLIPQTADPYKPVAITDLTVTPEGTNLNLSWSAPYDLDRYGTVTICSLYDIRVSGESMVDTPTSPFNPNQTNPGSLSNWGSAQSIATYFSPAPAIPAPLAYGTRQTVTIANYPANTTLLFAIKSQDSTGNWSYISNVAGIGGGNVAVGWAADLAIAYNVRGEVELTWRGNAATYDIFAAGSDGIFVLLAGGVAATTYTDASAPAVRFYQVRPIGSQAGTRTVGKYTFNFVKQTGKTGINTFSIPFSSDIKGRNAASIVSADDIINDIGVDKVEFVGRWNDAEQKSEGRVVYTTDPNNWYGPSFTLEQGKSYQISVGENVSWSIIGKK